MRHRTGCSGCSTPRPWTPTGLAMTSGTTWRGTWAPRTAYWWLTGRSSDWAGIREIEEDGVLLVRPDKHIGWRSMTLPRDPEKALRDALTRILSR